MAKSKSSSFYLPEIIRVRDRELRIGNIVHRVDLQ